jgi:hypothetical protein
MDKLCKENFLALYFNFGINVAVTMAGSRNQRKADQLPFKMKLSFNNRNNLQTNQKGESHEESHKKMEK